MEFLEKIKELEKPLPDEDVEFRIGVAKKQSKGFSLLAYKTSRADVKRLNSVFGMLWGNDFFYDKKDILTCNIRVYNTEIKEWVTRSDVGVESFSEKEKGSYSDAFKRVGFRWGIGNELYKYPFIWIKWDDWYSKNGKDYPKVMVQSWKKKGDTIVDGNGKIMFNLKGKIKPSKKEKTSPIKTELKKDTRAYKNAREKFISGVIDERVIEANYSISKEMLNEFKKAKNNES